MVVTLRERVRLATQVAHGYHVGQRTGRALDAQV